MLKIQFFLIAILYSGSGLIVQETGAEKSWQERLPVSMNGERPSFVTKDFAKSHWHSLRLNNSCSRDVFERDGELYPDLSLLRAAKLFKSKDGELLKKAIIDEDLDEIRRLIGQDVDINEVGVDGLTPLHIAFFVDSNPGPFETLLANDASPCLNLQPYSDKYTPLRISGRSVAHLTAMTKYNRLFDNVFKNKDAFEIVGRTPLKRKPISYAFLGGIPDDVKERLKLFIDAGANVNEIANFYRLEGLRDAKLFRALVEMGADCSRWFPMANPLFKYDRLKPARPRQCYCQLIHLLAKTAIETPERFSDRDLQEYQKVLEEKGFSLEKAKADLIRWQNWQDRGLGDLIKIEHGIRLRDETGKALQAWYDKDLETAIARIEQQNQSRWKNDVQWRINRLPPSLTGSTSLAQKYKGRWSNIVVSKILPLKLVSSWKRNVIFKDPKVESLKNAMFAGDIDEMERLIKIEKVDLNSVGSDNLTLLFLSLGIDQDPRPFELLLDSGANPNIPNKAKHAQKSLAVVHVIAKATYCRHFRMVFEKGGDASLIANGKSSIGHLPSPTATSPNNCIDWPERVEYLCERGANINKAFGSRSIVEIILKNHSMKSATVYDSELAAVIRQGAHVQRIPWVVAVKRENDLVQHKCFLGVEYVLSLTGFTKDHAAVKALEVRGISFEQTKEDLWLWRKSIENGSADLTPYPF